MNTESLLLQKTTLKPNISSLIPSLALFILANLTALWLHIWQLKWELSNPEGLFGWKIYIDGWLSSIPFNDGMWLRQFSTPLFDQIFVTIYIHGFVLCRTFSAIYIHSPISLLDRWASSLVDSKSVVWLAIPRSS